MASSTDAHNLKKTLGLGGLILYGMGDMLGAGIYGLIGAAAGVLGNLIWAGFLISAVAACLTALSYASLGSRYPKAGGAAYVAERAFGSPAVAYVMGLSVMASGLVSMATAARAFASYGNAFLPLFHSAVIIALFIGMLGLINFLGMRQSSLMNALCTAVELGGLLFIIGVGVSYWGDVDLTTVPADASTEISATALLLFQGALLTFYAFIGFEDLLNVSEEVKNPERNFAIGILVAVLLTCAIYLAVAISAVSVVPYQELASTSQGPLTLVVQKAAPWFNPKLFGLIALFAIANTALLNYIMASRLAFGMARQGLLPKAFSRLHSHRHTPYVAIIAVFFVVMGFAMAGDLSQLAAATSILLLLVFIAMNSALIILKMKKDEPRGSFEIPLIIPILAIVINIALLAARMFDRDLTPFGIAAAIVVIVMVSYLLFRRRISSVV